MNLEIKVVTWPEGVNEWYLVNDYLKLRKRVFIDEMDWPLFHAEELEFEQYDGFDTVYIVATLDGKTVGGARLRRTDQLNGKGKIKYSYMIRDACLGILPGLPNGLCLDDPPVDEKVWELTRLVVSGHTAIARTILQKANDYLREKNAQSVLFLGSPAFRRMAKSLGWVAKEMGPVSSNEDGSFQVFDCQII